MRGLHVGNPEAIAETVRQVPGSVDRGYSLRGVTRVITNSAFMDESDAEWKRRRDACGHGMQFNKASQHVQLMLDVIAERSDVWAGKEQVELVEEYAHLTLDIITRILFGKDVRLDTKLPYQTYQGAIEQIPLS